MYRDVDFYGLSEEEQQRLIRGKRVTTSDGLLREIPKGRPAVRIFEESLENLILKCLESGRYSIHELADEFGIEENDVRQIINKFRRHGRDDFTGESFKYNLLSEWNGVIRVKNMSQRHFEYSLETIPFFARIADPTLVLSLLEVEEQLFDLPVMAEGIPSNTASELDEIYALLFGEFWDIDPQAIFDEITNYERTYVETSLAPLPSVRALTEYEKIRSRFAQPDTVYNRFRNLEKSIRGISEEFTEIMNRGQPGVRMYQAVSIELFDMLRAAKLEDPRLVLKVEEAINNVASALDPEADNSVGTEEGMPGEIALEDEILAVLDEDWMTAEQVYNELPADVQMVSPQDSVQEALDEHAALGMISSRINGEDVEYSSKFGTVGLRDSP
ncbi:hypothetical protein [Halalkalicoccus salilacus]|uniref:hypothetical protein n=1 Tax=Halalkalicoccus salilacus TaxID=3117459 RepID=UPI00300EE249